MTFDWNDYLALARELGSRSDEASLRSSISRAYYAIFGKAAYHAFPAGVPLDVADKHRHVWTQYRTQMGRGMTEVGNTGDALKRLRQKADYDADFLDLGQQVASVLVRAQRIAKLLDKAAR